MKRMISAVWLLLFALSLASCKGTQMTDSSCKAYTDVEGIEVHIVNDALTTADTSLKIRWVNSSRYDILYGEPYDIQREQNGEWVSCAKTDELAFTSIGYTLSAQSSYERAYNTEGIFDISVPGKYRFCAGCSVYDGKHSGHNECSLWAEFIVNDPD